MSKTMIKIVATAMTMAALTACEESWTPDNPDYQQLSELGIDPDEAAADTSEWRFKLTSRPPSGLNSEPWKK